ncbi:MAG: RNA-binding S4 domain-containing protein [Saprospiraceae bacterium]|nr:RNA-binding S4 domain-containing protein [Saprospiraceae bacterium]HMX87793.1 RNA-binding S4 domain-containing protein [Saprospiraceae bacterium]HMZ39369.1 RNA-binding S4 domain-containing protein [Saprospiraceae bacterium]HNA64849.1 RNA-binding S4 domain-containing protein [Saprospiraceae bacterium]HNE61430.1 RNA-binding S4 domain-containing protein [Saprospiraceae bacterium]
MTSNKLRIDKWLWCVRIFKSRSIAAEYCRKGRVQCGDQELKPSSQIENGMVITVRKDSIRYSYRICSLPAQRLSATLAKDCFENLTPQEELNRLHEKQTSHFYRSDGIRPTKKERRELEEFLEDF